MSIDQVPYENWITQVKKELKLEDLSSKHVIVQPDLIIDPFFERPNFATSGTRSEKTWKIKEVFYCNDLIVESVSSALKLGVNYLEFRQLEECNSFDFLEGILLEYVELHFFFDSIESQNKIAEITDFFKNQKPWLDSKLHFSFTSNDPIIDPQVFSFGLDPKKSNVDGLTECLNQIIDKIDQIEHSSARQHYMNNVSIYKNIGTQIIEELAMTLAIRNLWQNICTGFDLTGANVTLHAKCSPNKENDEELNFIELSAKSLTSVLGGYEIIEVLPASNENQDFHKRISHNHLHMAQMENLLNFSSTGYSGSFQIEKIAQSISEKVWNNIGRN